MVARVAHITDGFGRKTHNSHPSKLQVSRALSIFVLPLRLGTSYSCNSWGAGGNRMIFMESQGISELTQSKLVAVLIFGDLWYLVYVCLDFQGFLGQKCEARPNVRNYWPFTRGGYMQRTGTPAMGSRLPHQTLPSRSPLEGEGWSILSLAAAAQFDMVLIYKDYSQTPYSVCSPVSVKLCMQKLRAIYWNVKVLCTEGYCNGSLTCQLDVNWKTEQFLHVQQTRTSFLCFHRCHRCQITMIPQSGMVDLKTFFGDIKMTLGSWLRWLLGIVPQVGCC